MNKYQGRLSLKDTHPVYIYGVCDPRTGRVWYVGMGHNVAERVSIRRWESRRRLPWSEDTTLEETVAAAQVFEVTYHPVARYRESYWIGEMLRRGEPLINRFLAYKQIARHIHLVDVGA